MNGKISLTKLIIGFSGILLMVCLFPVKANAETYYTGAYDSSINNYLGNINTYTASIKSYCESMWIDVDNMAFDVSMMRTYLNNININSNSIISISNALNGVPGQNGIIDYCYAINSQCTTISNLLNQIDADTSNISNQINLIKASCDSIKSNTDSMLSLLRNIDTNLLNVLNFIKQTDLNNGYSYLNVSSGLNLNGKTFISGEPLFFSNNNLSNDSHRIGIIPSNCYEYTLLITTSNSSLSNLNIILYNGENSVNTSVVFNKKYENVNNYQYAYILTVRTDSEYVNGIRYIFSGSNVTGNLYFLGREIGAVEILNYMESQWNQTSGSVSDLNTQTSSLSTEVGTINTFEDNMMNNYNTAYAATGISSYNISGAGNEMVAVSGLVNSTWNKLPVKLRFYITTVLVVGFIGVVLNVTGRIKSKMERI